MPLAQLSDHAPDAYFGPPLLNGERLPYPTYPGGQVSVVWAAEHQTRKYADGRLETVGEPTYRPSFEFSFDYLEAVIEAGVWTILRTAGPLSFAPYSKRSGGEIVPLPESFDVLPPDEIPDTADLVLARFPFGLSLTGTRTWALEEIPTTDPGDAPTSSAPLAYPAGMRILSGEAGVAEEVGMQIV